MYTYLLIVVIKIINKCYKRLVFSIQQNTYLSKDHLNICMVLKQDLESVLILMAYFFNRFVIFEQNFFMDHCFDSGKFLVTMLSGTSSFSTPF